MGGNNGALREDRVEASTLDFLKIGGRRKRKKHTKKPIDKDYLTWYNIYVVQRKEGHKVKCPMCDSKLFKVEDYHYFDSGRIACLECAIVFVKIEGEDGE